MQLRWHSPDDVDAIAALRTWVATRPPSSFFLSPHWLDTCLRMWPASLGWRLVRFESAPGRTVGFALLGQGVQRRHGVLTSRMLALNESMDPGLDEAFVEMNGLYGGHPEGFGDALEALLSELHGHDDWDELKLSGLLPGAAARARELASRHRMTVHEISVKPTFEVDLERIRANHRGDVYAHLSANSRQQLRRSRRAATRDLGELSLERASDADTALTWFDAAGPLHRARWAERSPSTYGGFDNRRFVDFHRALIRGAFEAGAIDMLRLRAGPRPIAYLYNLVYERTACFYLSGIDYTVGSQYRPGLLAHLMAIERYLETGLSRYDLMAGESRYKETLASSRSTQEWLVLQRPRLKLGVERFGRAVRAAWRARRGDPPA